MRAIAFLLLLAAPVSAQQVADSGFTPPIARPSFATGTGPLIAIDEAHHNFHTAGGRYYAFARLLRLDGYRVRALAVPFTVTALLDVGVLVIANARHARSVDDPSLPTPSAFTADEIAAVRRWVERGGALLLIADHMPYGGAAADLAAAFGFTFTNGYAVVMQGRSASAVPAFTRAAGTLRAHPVTDGDIGIERIDSVRSFTGQAFTAPPEAAPLLVLPPGTVSLLPTRAGVLDSTTAREDASGRLQGALLEVGLGRVAVFGEAAMFTSQLAGPQRIPVGMSSADAPQNPELVRAVVRWLARQPRL